LDESKLSDDIPQVNEQGNEILVAPFQEDEIKHSIFQMEHNEALGSDGFLAEFYQVLWEIIKNDALALFTIYDLASKSIKVWDKVSRYLQFYLTWLWI
jgi:hypothetical protein